MVLYYELVAQCSNSCGVGGGKGHPLLIAGVFVGAWLIAHLVVKGLTKNNKNCCDVKEEKNEN